MALLEKLKIVSRSLVGGGCINRAEKIVTADGKNYFLKTHASPPKGFFKAEALGLERLREKAKSLVVPKVIKVSDQGLLLEYLEPAEKNPTEENFEALALGLAEFHQFVESQFGFASDNFIGLSEQKNSWNQDWADFFIEKRLCFQAELGKGRGWFQETDSFRAYLDWAKEVLSADKVRPSLVHGDLWSGNVFWSKKGAALIDPAVYFGDSEVDLAFSEMFGGFPGYFYNSYFSARAKSEYYSEKKRIYNLYHLMNHANIFGGSYCQQVNHQLGMV